MKRFLVLLLLPCLSFAKTQVLVAESSLQNQQNAKALVLQNIKESGRVLFQICTLADHSQNTDQHQISDCETIGKASGYSSEDLLKRIEQLEKESTTHLLFNGGYVVLGTLIGAVTGGVLAQQFAIRNHPSQMYALISYFAGGVLVGGGVGLTLTVLTKQNVSDLLSAQLFSQETEVLEQVQSAELEKVNIVVLKKSLQKTVNDIQEVLLGIP